MKKQTLIILIIIILLSIVIGYKITGNAIKMDQKVKLQTSEGDIVIELYPEKAPITVENFLTYVKEGAYEGTVFHRVIADFMIQGGGFTTDGTQKQTHDPIKLESDNGLKNERYTVAMARTAVLDSATNQFFINTNNNEFLNYGFRDEGYAVFGKVVEGMDVVDKIGKVQTGPGDKPIEEVVIENAEVI